MKRSIYFEAEFLQPEIINPCENPWTKECIALTENGKHPWPTTAQYDGKKVLCFWGREEDVNFFEAFVLAVKQYTRMSAITLNR